MALSGNSTLDLDISGSNADFLNISGLLSVSGTANLVVNHDRRLTRPTYTLATFANSPSLSLSDFSYTSPHGYTLSVSGTALTLSGTPFSGPPIWQGSLSNSWTDTTSWNTGNVPNAVGAMALVGSSTAAPTAITLDGAETVGQLTLSATSAARAIRWRRATAAR